MKNEIHLVEEEEEKEAGKIARACIGDKKVETREGTGRGVCRREKEGEREKESGFFLRVRRGCTSGCWPDSRTFQDVRPFLFQALLSLALLLFASCAAEAADTSKPSFPSLRSPRRKPLRSLPPIRKKISPSSWGYFHPRISILRDWDCKNVLRIRLIERVLRVVEYRQDGNYFEKNVWISDFFLFSLI